MVGKASLSVLWGERVNSCGLFAIFIVFFVSAPAGHSLFVNQLISLVTGFPIE